MILLGRDRWSADRKPDTVTASLTALWARQAGWQKLELCACGSVASSQAFLGPEEIGSLVGSRGKGQGGGVKRAEP